MLRLTAIEATYALIVMVIATAGFTTESTSMILLAAFLALPSSVIAVPAYYVVYGLLALVPGAKRGTPKSAPPRVLALWWKSSLRSGTSAPCWLAAPATRPQTEYFDSASGRLMASPTKYSSPLAPPTVIRDSP